MSIVINKKLQILYVIFIQTLIITCDDFISREQNDKFCIRTDPILFDELEKPLVPNEPNLNCDIIATTMSSKEKESFINTMCKDHGSSHKDDYHFLQLQYGDLTGRESYRDICSGKTNPLLAWIPFEMVQKNYVHEMNPKERYLYIAKATDMTREKTELCHFRHLDLVTNLPDALFTCIVMIFEDNFYGVDNNINVLVELQPIMYELRNITYMPWVNTTTSYKTILGKTSLKNTAREKKQIYSSMEYAFVEKIKLNTSTVYQGKMEKLPLLFEHNDNLLELDTNGIGGLKVNEKAYFGRTMDPKTSVNLEVIGQWADVTKQFHADIYEYFGVGLKRRLDEIHGGEVSFVRIDSTEPVFEMAESTNLAIPTIFKEDNNIEKKFEQMIEETNGTSKERNLENKKGNSPYPGFYPWFVLSLLIFGSAVLIAVGGMVRSCTKKEEKFKYKLAKPAV